MPALDFALTLQTARRAAITLDEGQSLTIRIARALQSWRGYVVSEQAQGLDKCLWVVIISLCHVVPQVHLGLEVSVGVTTIKKITS